MKIRTTGLLATLATSLLMTGCASGPNGQGGITEDQAKVIAGSVIGGVVGHQFGKAEAKLLPPLQALFLVAILVAS